MNVSRIKSAQAGVTLIELLVALVLTIVLVGGVVMMHMTSRGAFLDAEQLSRIQENIRFASDYMVRDIRTAGFRDEGSLPIGHELQIMRQYLGISAGGDVLTVRYAGKGHCTEAFDEFRLVENQYSVNNDGELICRGRSLSAATEGGLNITSKPWKTVALGGGVTQDYVGLVKGLSGISFEKVCPNGGTSCACDLVDHFDDSCIGVRIGMEFAGLRDIDNPANTTPRTVELTAAFRNIVIDRANKHAFP